MPSSARSLRRSLAPLLLCLAPLAASAASDVTILRDEWGIPQVYADDVYGLYAGFGYAVAEDRLFQMEMARRSVLGTVSEVLGAEHVAYDTQTRANFDPAKIRAQIEALPPENRDILRGYAAGYNKRLAEVMADKGRLLPREFTEFGFEPTPWTEFDIAMIYVGTMAGRFSHYSNELNNAKVLDALIGQHGEAQGRQIFDQIFWIEDPLAPTTVPEGEQYPKKARGACAGRCHALRRALDAADPGQRGRPAPRQQPLDPRAEEDHRRQHHSRQRTRSSATSIRPTSSASACTAPASTSPGIRPSPCRTSSSAPTAPSPGGPPPDRSTSTTMCSSSSTRRTRTSTATTAAGPTCGFGRRRSRSRAATP